MIWYWNPKEKNHWESFIKYISTEKLNRPLRHENCSKNYVYDTTNQISPWKTDHLE